MATHNLLDENVPVYFRFVDNQVLTSGQLNRVLDHINYQDKITRAGLIGVGNMCGLEISRSGNTISISEGIAVTSDGDVIKFNPTSFVGYKAFSDSQVKYGHFLKNETTVELYELKESSAAVDVNSLASFEADQSLIINDLVFILYLECYEKEEEDCSTIECNAQGKEVVNNIRLLMTTVENAKSIAEQDSIFTSTLTDGFDSVAVQNPKIYAKRIVLNNASSSTLSTLKNAYSTSFAEISTLLGDLGQITLFEDQMNDFPINMVSFFNGLTATSLNFQYLYDFYKDLVTAYNELADNLNDTYTICCPDPDAFPKHIFRGGLNAQSNVYKHRFYASPIHDNDQSALSLKAEFDRILEMIMHFKVETKDVIEITPSRNTENSLGDRAMPFYYDVDKVLAPTKMVNSWKLNKTHLVPNYYKIGYPAGFSDPLDYCLEGHSFFRVAGHVGKDVISAVKDITDIRNNKGLGFDIMPIAVGSVANEATLDYDKYSIYFEDLQIILQAWNEEIKCIVSGSSKFLSKFSIAEAGVHLDYVFNYQLGEDVASRAEMAAVPAAFAIIDDGGRTKEYKSRSAAGYQMVSGQYKTERVNTVVENIGNIEGSTGSFWTGLLDVEDNKNDVKVKFENAVSDQIINWADKDKILGIEIPAIMLGALKDTEDNKLLDIEDFTEENLELFINSLQNQCDTAKAEKLKLQSAVSNQAYQIKDRSYLEQYYFVMNNVISTCCMIERFKVLYTEILKRKQELLNGLVLKEFIKKHPSAEHKAGVNEGGTLIVLYYSKNETNLTSVSAVNTESAVSITGRSRELKQYVETRNKIANQIQLLQKMDQKITKERTIGLASDAVFVEQDRLNLINIYDYFALPRTESIPDGTVIGDLCLPYICCSGTPATTFIFPDRETDLIVSKTHVCVAFEEDPGLVSITPTPADGDVMAFVNGGEIVSAIQPKDGKVFFDPKVVSESDYGEEITFTVNGQNVSPRIAIYRKPEASFTVSAPKLTNENRKATVLITNTSTPIEGQVFNWDLEVEEFEDNRDSFEFSFSVEAGNSYKFDLKLTATNGQCSTDFNVPLEFTAGEVPGEVDLKVEKNLVCKVLEKPADPIGLFPTPPKGEVKAYFEDKEIKDCITVVEEVMFFDPNKIPTDLYGTPIKLKVDEEDVAETIIIYLQPQAGFSILEDKISEDRKKITIKFKNESKPLEGPLYTWTYNGIKEEDNRTEFSKSFDVQPGILFNLNVILNSKNGRCSDDFSDDFEWLIPKNDDTTDESGNCEQLSVAKIGAGKDRLEKYLTQHTVLSGGSLGSIYTKNLLNFYEIFSSDIPGSLQGANDVQLKKIIEDVQALVQENYLANNGLDIQQQWLAMLYLESMLLYFYIQSCRQKSIAITTGITDKWIDIISLMSQDKELFQKILNKIPYQNMLNDVKQELDPFISAKLKDILNKVISILINTIG